MSHNILDAEAQIKGPGVKPTKKITTLMSLLGPCSRLLSDLQSERPHKSDSNPNRKGPAVYIVAYNQLWTK